MLNLAGMIAWKMGIQNEDVISEMILNVYEKRIEKMPASYIKKAMVNSLLTHSRLQRCRSKYIDSSEVKENMTDDEIGSFIIPSCENDKIFIVDMLHGLNSGEKRVLLAMMMSDYIISEASELLHENYFKVRRKWQILRLKLKRMFN